MLKKMWLPECLRAFDAIAAIEAIQGACCGAESEFRADSLEFLTCN
jgi:hypothetical protein